MMPDAPLLVFATLLNINVTNFSSGKDSRANTLIFLLPKLRTTKNTLSRVISLGFLVNRNFY